MLRMRKFLTIPLAVLVLLSFAGCSNGSSSNLSSSAAASGTVSQTAPATSATSAGTSAATAAATTTEATTDLISPTPEDEIPQIEGYKLLWYDEFNGTGLDEDIWNREIRGAGWTNSELQAYTDSDQNVYVKDGLLVLKAIETVLAKGPRTPDMGGKASTSDVGKAIAEVINAGG